MNAAEFTLLMIFLAMLFSWVGGQPPGTDEERQERAVFGALFGMMAAHMVAISSA